MRFIHTCIKNKISLNNTTSHKHITNNYGKNYEMFLFPQLFVKLCLWLVVLFRLIILYLICIFFISFIFIPWIRTGLQNPYGYGWISKWTYGSIIMHVPILSKRLYVHLMKKATAFEKLWIYSMVLYLLDDGKSPFLFLSFFFYLSSVFRKFPCQHMSCHMSGMQYHWHQHRMKLASYHAIFKHCYVGFIKI